jgi:hypothetical protein
MRIERRVVPMVSQAASDVRRIGELAAANTYAYLASQAARESGTA